MKFDDKILVIGCVTLLAVFSMAFGLWSYDMAGAWDIMKMTVTGLFGIAVGKALK